MICPVCDGEGDSEACGRCGGALLLHGRYALVRVLGSGGQSRVYAARDRQAGGEVAIKIMSLGRAREWKNVELFRRAATVLGGLHHPGVPRLVEYFEEERPSAELYCLVHELIDGQTLAELQKRGLRLDEAAGRALLVEILGILRYLHGLSPPVIHRDLKPSNLMRRRDGRLVLIDFDLVRDVLLPDGGSTTTAGTPGYTPLEQYAGEALPASDLHAAGVTLAVLLSRKEPLDLRGPSGQGLALRDHVHVGPDLLRVLEKMAAPDVAHRYQSVEEVLADLERPAKEVEDRPARSPAAFALPVAGAAAVALATGFGLYLSARPPAAPTVAVASRPRAPARPAPPPPPPPPAAPAPVADPPHLPSRLSPETVAAALVGPTWAGTAERRKIELRFSGARGKLKAELTTFDASGRGRTITPLKVEIAALGTLVLRARTVEDGVGVERTLYGELSRDLASLGGTRETRYDSAGSSYVTDEKWSVSRVP